MNPEFVNKNVSDKCREAGVCRQVYYDAMEKPEFKELIRDYREKLLQSEVTNLIQVGIKEAKNGSFQHWKVLMEMAGEYAAKTKTEVTTPEGLAAALTVTFTKNDDE